VLPPSIEGLVLVFLGICVGAAAIGACLIRCIGRKYKLELERVGFERELRIVENALDEHRSDGGGTGGLRHPYVLLPAPAFLELGRLESYETVQRKGKLTYLNNIVELQRFEKARRIVFFSHQWTSFTNPDATGDHYETMVGALERVMEEKAWELEHVYVWVDFTCVPQRTRATTELAISTLSVYASRAHAFVAVVPDVVHEETGKTLDGETYQTRLWCRAECFSHLLLNDAANTMWLATSGAKEDCVRMPSHWLRAAALRIFEGQSTCCQRGHDGRPCDRELLVQPLLGLYASLYVRAMNDKEAKTNAEALSQRGGAAFSPDAGRRPALLERQPTSRFSTSSGRQSFAARFSNRQSFRPSVRQSRMSGRSSRRSTAFSDMSSTDTRRMIEANLFGHMKRRGVPGLPGLLRRQASSSSIAASLNSLETASSLSAALGLQRTSIDLNQWSKASAAAAAYEMIEQMEEIVFPPEYTFKQTEGDEEGATKELFGSLIPLMKAIVDHDESLRSGILKEDTQLRARRMTTMLNQDHLKRGLAGYFHGAADDQLQPGGSSSTAVPLPAPMPAQPTGGGEVRKSRRVSFSSESKKGDEKQRRPSAAEVLEPPKSTAAKQGGRIDLWSACEVCGNASEESEVEVELPRQEELERLSRRASESCRNSQRQSQSDCCGGAHAPFSLQASDRAARWGAQQGHSGKSRKTVAERCSSRDDDDIYQESLRQKRQWEMDASRRALWRSVAENMSAPDRHSERDTSRERTQRGSLRARSKSEAKDLGDRITNRSEGRETTRRSSQRLSGFGGSFRGLLKKVGWGDDEGSFSKANRKSEPQGEKVGLNRSVLEEHDRRQRREQDARDSRPAGKQASWLSALDA
jgi:hypothetical protein